MSKIEWTERTWNPLAGCTPISPGCTHCYAATMARRLEAMGQSKYAGTAERRGDVDVFTGRIKFDDKLVLAPLHWRKPTTVFVNSMSDLFHEEVPSSFIDRVFSVMLATERHTYQVLTKRPEQAAKWFAGLQEVADAWAPETKFGVFNCRDVLNLRWMHAAGNAGCPLPKASWPLSNVWMGTSCEDQQRFDTRHVELQKIPAAVRFVSLEPLLGPIRLNLTGIGWVIAGGESGPGARRCEVSWIRSIVQQCAAAGVPCFVKQLGRVVTIPNDSFSEWPRDGDGLIGVDRDYSPLYQGESINVRLADPKGGNPDEWPQDLRIRQMPTVQQEVSP